MNNECKSCGYNLLENEIKCPYCGSSNPNFNQTKQKTNDFIKKVEDVFPSNNSWQNNNTNQTETDKKEINVCLLIFLVVVFWPAAVIYAIVKMSK